MTTTVATTAPVVSELRRTRQRRRLGDQEWFDVAYRVYLAALVGGGVLIAAVDRVDDAVIGPTTLADIERHGPAVLGLAAAVAIAAGLRSGAHGGPIALEAADVRYLLLAPVDRSAIMRRPVAQRARALAGIGALAGGIAGVLAARRLPGSTAAWGAAGVLAGGCAAALFAAVAVLAHVGRLGRAAATALAALVVGAQSAAMATPLPGPTTPFGDLALWGMRQRPADLVAVAATVALVALAVWRSGALRPESLLRRADLVSQLRFAVTMQDLRTVMLLRRQLAGEQARRRPWQLLATLASAGAGSHSGVGFAVRRRGLRSLARMPLVRVLRALAFAAFAGGCAVATLRGTTPALIGSGVALFAMSLELLEPLSQEVDHRDITGTSPVTIDLVLTHLLVVGALAVVPFALVAAAVVAALEPGAAGAAFALAVPCALVGACGAAVSIVGDTRSPSSTTGASMTVPEFAGFATVIRSLLPVAISTLGALPIVAAREVPTGSTVVRSTIAMLIVTGACALWVRRHNEYSARLRAFLEVGR